ncbi:MAG: hypothetical protein QUU85_10860, partial [Candidatus Eisenbacteria bacterium]|nr:hypothetical protein [Candidatus Eisenbacteria bacterium]
MSRAASIACFAAWMDDQIDPPWNTFCVKPAEAIQLFSLPKEVELKSVESPVRPEYGSAFSMSRTRCSRGAVAVSYTHLTL